MISLASYNAFVAAMQQSRFATYTACAATLCFCATVWTITAIKRQATPFAETLNARGIGFKQEVLLWRIHREHLRASWLRKSFVLLWCAGTCLFVTALTSTYYRENVPPAVLTISSK